MVTILEKIVSIKDTLPKKQRILCNYIATNSEQIGVMTVAELASCAGVGTTTVIRLTQTLGYSNFSNFKRDIANAALLNSSSYRTLKQSIYLTTPTESSDLLYSIATDGQHLLGLLCTPAVEANFEKAVQLLLKAKKIFTIGLRSSKSLALYFEYSANCFMPNVQQLSNESTFLYDNADSKVEKDDVLLVFSMWPCTKITVDVAELCHKKGVPVIVLTNTNLNPIVKFADVVLNSYSVNHSSGNVSAVALIEALVAELGRRTKPRSSENLERLESILNEKGIIVWDY